MGKREGVRSNTLFPAVHHFAQTNIQLLNQLQGRYKDSEIDNVRAAYEVACDLFAGQFRSSGKPFLAHLVGTSSILAWLSASVETIVAGLLHAAYVDGNFGSRSGGHSPSNRKRIQDAVGVESEEIVFAYTNFPWRSPAAIPRLVQRSSNLSDLEKEVLLVRLANELEEYLDLGLLYCEDSEQRLKFSEIYGSYMIDLAGDLGYDNLSNSLRQAFDYVRVGDSGVDSPRSPKDPYSRILLPEDRGSNTTNAAVEHRQSEVKHGFLQFPEQALLGTVSLRFEEQALKFPESVAIDQGGNKLTYDQLCGQVKRVSDCLLAKFGPGNDPVLTLCSPGQNMIVAALGVLKAGKIWVPLDASHPLGRLSEIAKDANAAGMVTDDDHLDFARSFFKADQALIPLGHALTHSAAAQEVLEVTPDSLACVLYTSGSTGTPKGVVHNHRNLLHLALRGTNALSIDENDRITLLPSCSQIAGVTDVLRSLLNGATLLPFDVHRNSLHELTRWLKEKRATVFHSSPTFFRLLAETFHEEDFFPDVRIIHLGGEATKQVDVGIFQKHFSSKCRLVNNLGGTELSGYCQFFVDSEYTPGEGNVPAGFAVEGVEISLHPDRDEITGDRRIGEIKVTSPYVALGYWQRPEETEKAFAQHQNGERTYFTGDFGYFREDGCLMYSGRNDSQFNIHGNRIDAGEIESVIESHDAVERVAVTRSRHQEEKLVAYVATKRPNVLSAEQLEKSTRTRLPSFMVPDIVLVEELPLTPNGKVDFNKLHELKELHTPKAKTRTTHSSPAEECIARLWTGLLDVKNVGVEDDFFSLGGDSLVAMRLAGYIENDFAIRLDIKDIFEHPTVSKLANLVVARSIQNDYEALSDSERDLLLSTLNEIENFTEKQVEELIGSGALLDKAD
jgi:amino acid adenylation domain-containing protein